MPGRKILLVEGKDDEHVLKHICGNRGILPPDEIKDYDGKDELLESIPVRLKASKELGDAVGVVIDADTDMYSRWQSLRGIFTQVGYQNIPTQPNPQGTIIEPPAETILPRTGVWIMPDNQAPGKLENLLRQMVPGTDALIGYATDVVNDIPEQRFIQNDKPKAVIHTWLAWQSEPGRPYGTAITAGFLDHNVPQVNVLVSWLERLFNQPESP